MTQGTEKTGDAWGPERLGGEGLGGDTRAGDGPSAPGRPGDAARDELVPMLDLREPRLPGSIVLRRTVDELIDAAAAELLIQAKNCVRAFGDFHLAVSSFAGAEPLLMRLMYDPSFRDLPWKRTHLWMVEEAHVNGEPTRFPEIAELLVAHSDIPEDQVHAMVGGAGGADGDGERAAAAYSRMLREHLGWREKGQDRLDYALLPLLDRGFTHGSAVREAGSLVGAFKEGAASVTALSATMLNATRLIAVIGSGAELQPTVATLETLKKPRDAGERLHVTGLRPVGGELRWYLDAAATQGG